MHPYRMHPNPSFSTSLVYDVDSDVTVALDDTNRMWAYDLGADTWTMKGVAPVDELRFYDPVSGLVVAVGDDGDENTLGLPLWGYEVETDTWTPIPQAEPLAIGPHYEFFAYDASVDRLVAYANAWGPPDEDGNQLWEAKTWLFDIRTGTWSGTGAVTPPGFTAGMWGMQPAIAYDEAAQRTVLLGQGQSAAYDATADRWETLYVGTRSDEPGACGDPPGVPPDAVHGLRPGERAARRLRGHGLLVGRSGVGAEPRRRAGVRYADPRVDRPARGEPAGHAALTRPTQLTQRCCAASIVTWAAP